MPASNFSPGEIGDAVETAKRLGVTGFVATQDEYSLLERGIEDALLPVLETHRLSLVPYFPLAERRAVGQVPQGQADAGRRAPHRIAPSDAERFFGGARTTRSRRLTAFAESRGHTLLELAMSWLAARPQVASIITGATKPEQIEANVKAVGVEAQRRGHGRDRQDHACGVTRGTGPAANRVTFSEPPPAM